MTPGLLIYCRPGFEKEAATEISAACHREGYAKAKPDSGLVLFVPNDPEMAREPPITWGELVFARQMIRDVRLIDDLPTMDRATPVAAAAATLGLRFSDVWLETADTNDAKEMSSFCRKFDRPLRNALSMKNLLTEDARKPRPTPLFSALPRPTWASPTRATSHPGLSAFRACACPAAPPPSRR